MVVEPLAIPEVKRLVPKVFRDARGAFCEAYSKRALDAAGLALTFVQDNHSISHARGVVRGLHFQSHPYAQGKLVRVLRGSIFDVAVDLRRGSPTYGQHVSAVLSAENWEQLWIPVGFAHGFCTLEPDTEVLYKVTAYYSPEHDLGLQWDDPDLGIDWPVSAAEATLSDKDRRHPRLAELGEVFTLAQPAST
jgi:dTDP-4-dehydrorhamnose 3,5-epimerase